MVEAVSILLKAPFPWFGGKRRVAPMPVVEGGGECGSEGFRTLCIPCHKRVTAELAKRRAAGKRQEKAVRLDAERGLFAGLC